MYTCDGHTRTHHPTAKQATQVSGSIRKIQYVSGLKTRMPNPFRISDCKNELINMKERKLVFDNNTKSSEINISPLIDIVFILLIFFIVTTVFVEETGIEVQKPQAATADQLEKESILIAISDEGKVFYGGREIGVRGVRNVVRRLLNKNNRPVIVQADRRSSIDIYSQVHDEAAKAGAQIINLATRK